MARQQGWFAFLLGLVILASLFIVKSPFELGLDFRGGSQLILEVQPLDSSEKIKSEQLDSVKAVLEKRVNLFGVSESSLRSIGKNQLLLEQPLEQNTEEAARKLGKTALLEFRAQRVGTSESFQRLRIQNDQLDKISLYKELSNSKKIDTLGSSSIDNQLDVLRDELGLAKIELNETEKIIQIRKKINSQILKLFEPSYLTGTDLDRANTRPTQNLSSWEVTLSFNNVGGEKFAKLTKSIAGSGRSLGIFLDGESISQASVGEQYKVAGITGGSAVISSSKFTAETAGDLQDLLNGGALPYPVEIIQERQISPRLGSENIQKSLTAAFSGLALVAIFMVVFYRLPGVVAILALSCYALFNIALYALIPVTLTLPCIAGFILSIGMAVDANVLIFERVKDERRRGNTLIRSIDTGFSKAFSSILDGHITTLISCAALFYWGTSFVKGFASTLGIGVFISLFTALTCTRVLLRFLMSYKSLRKTTNFLSSTQLPKQTI